MKYIKGVMMVMFIVMLLAAVSGCNEGPLERAGKKVDKTVEDIKN